MSITEKIVSHIKQVSMGRFVFEHAQQIEKLADEKLSRSAWLVTRSGARSARTVLVADIPNKEGMRYCYAWAAAVRETLIEPRAADLYLLIVCDGITENECERIETDERFCRKYVCASEASIQRMIERTFFATPKSKQNISTSDPLIKALTDTSRDYIWFDENNQTKWKELLLGEQSGTDLAIALAQRN